MAALRKPALHTAATAIEAGATAAFAVRDDAAAIGHADRTASDATTNGGDHHTIAARSRMPDHTTTSSHAITTNHRKTQDAIQTMASPLNWLDSVVARDPRFKPAAYEFLFESLEFTKKRLARQRGGKVRHVSGPELLEGFRLLAIEQFGRLAKTVLADLGIQSTSDVGTMVFKLIESGEMEKSDEDSQADFDDVFDFDEAFCRDYKIELDELQK
jgi:uncharacterized repeat protein (TIGR04138 family)